MPDAQSMSRDKDQVTKRMPASWASKTLRLPKSLLPHRASDANLPGYLQAVTHDLYTWQREHGKGRFILHDGPPYANGDLHIGHALNKILKDITCRYQVSNGRQVDFRPGFDCHGLPIELKALQKQKELGNMPDGQALSTVEIRKIARESASNTVKLQNERFKEWAIMADWQNTWCTMDKDYEIRQLETFKLMIGNGQIYRRLKPVYWSPSTKTALAEAELEYNSDHRSTAAYVKFPLHEIPKVVRDMLPANQGLIAAVIWTTTPWTLPANRAIAVKRNMEYLVAQTEFHGVLVVSSSRLADFESFCPVLSILGKISGQELVGATYLHPFRSTINGPQPIVHADFVTDESGTGLVHVAPGHGMDDYKLCQEHGIELLAPVDDAGLFTAEAFPGSDILTGKDVLGAGNKLILNIFQSANMLLHTHTYRHKYPYDWRSKKPVIIRATRQWFADLSGIKDTALEALANVKFVPSGSFDRLSSFIKSRSEWCISRQRVWGVPIPALYDQSGEAIMTTQSISHIISMIKERGIDAWWSDDPTEPAWVDPSLRMQGPFTRGKDTMDVWFDSGTSWNEMRSERGEDAGPIADIYLEGTDQHRGWFQSSLLTKVAQLTSMGHRAAQAPFKTLITHGFTLDSKGKKMSKSEGNVVSPAQIMDGTLLPPLKRKDQKNGQDKRVLYDGMGPDALRLWVASSDLTHDALIGEPLLKAINGSLAKLRVTYKLLTGLLDTYDFAHKVRFNELCGLDRLAVLQSRKMREAADSAYQEYAYHRVVSAINTYVGADLSAFYIESIKDRCYVDADYSKSRTHAQAVLWEIYRNLSHVLSPITPLLVAEVRDYLPTQLQDYDPFRSLSEDRYTSIQGICEDPDLEAIFNPNKGASIHRIWDAIKQLQEIARSEKLMGSSLGCDVTIHLPAISSFDSHGQLLLRILHQLSPELADLFVVSKVTLTSTDPNQPPLAPIIQASEWTKQTTILIPSTASTENSPIEINISAPKQLKCIRCWKYTVPKEIFASASQLASDSNSSSDSDTSVPASPLAKLDVNTTQLEEPVCRRCLGVLEGLRTAEPDVHGDLFNGRPGIAQAAAACRDGGGLDREDIKLWDWNWDFDGNKKTKRTDLSD